MKILSQSFTKMNKTLLIVAHPSPHGFSHRLAKACAEALTARGREAEILDLYAPENRQEFLSFESVREIPADPSVGRMQQKISESSELIFIFPVWWYGEPAILKNFWDRNFTSGFAYRYEGSIFPKGLLKGKSVRIFATMDGPGFYHKLLWAPIRMTWWIPRIKFCGMRLGSFTLFDKMRKRDEKYRQGMLTKAVHVITR